MVGPGPSCRIEGAGVVAGYLVSVGGLPSRQLDASTKQAKSKFHQADFITSAYEPTYAKVPPKRRSMAFPSGLAHVGQHMAIGS